MALLEVDEIEADGGGSLGGLGISVLKLLEILVVHDVGVRAHHAVDGLVMTSD
jgi:hypothetical protein